MEHKTNPFTPAFDALPKTLPVFPLTGVLLLPGGDLPLNIFEQRYLNMVDDAMRTDRMIGMVQHNTDIEADNGTTPLFQTGCAGRITSYTETDDGRLLVNLSGLYRFRIIEELETMRGYRRVTPDWSLFRDDQEIDYSERFLNRDKMTPLLKNYFEKEGLACSWEAVDATEDWRLMTILSMICPFTPQEKQALLEARTPCVRAEILLTLLEMESVLDCSAKKH